MDIFSQLIQGFGLIFTPQPLLMILLGVVIGIIVGALPGLNVSTGLAIMLPLTFFMEPIPAISFLLGLYCAGTYGGSISAILVNAPGTPAAAATLLDGFPLTQKGQPLKALQMALYASVIAGLISCTILIFAAPPLASVALRFGPPEYFALAILGLAIVASVSGKSVLKGFIAAGLGLLLALVGQDPVTGTPRFTFGVVTLLSGFALVPALIGLFALSQVMRQAEGAWVLKAGQTVKIAGQALKLRELKESLLTIIRGSLLGTIIGAIPGTGASLAAFLSYGEAKRTSKRRKEFGSGCLEGVAAPESGNNGVTGATLIPLLTLGIPGDVGTAILLGAFMVQDLTPGPLLFQRSPDIVFALFAGLILCNIAMLAVGSLGTRFFYRIAGVNPALLYSTVLALCCVGSYVLNARLYDVFVCLGFGLLGYLLQKIECPLPPVVIGLILGPLGESNLRRGLLITHGDIGAFLFRPITLVLLVISIAAMVFFAIRGLRESKEEEERPGG